MQRTHLCIIIVDGRVKNNSNIILIMIGQGEAEGLFHSCLLALNRSQWGRWYWYCYYCLKGCRLLLGEMEDANVVQLMHRLASSLWGRLAWELWGRNRQMSGVEHCLGKSCVGGVLVSPQTVGPADPRIIESKRCTLDPWTTRGLGAPIPTQSRIPI